MLFTKRYIPYVVALLMLITSNSCVYAHLSDITFVLLGASGDLATRDLIPALFRLYRDKKLEKFALIGAALPSIDKQQILNQSKQFVHAYDQEEWDAFAQAIYYVSVDFNESEHFDQLNAIIQHAECEHGLSGNRLVYCATSCNFFAAITKALVQTGIIGRQCTTDAQPWQRIAYEKPFGYDLVTADAIQDCATMLLDKAQIFHIDHFLMTQAMKQLPALRFNSRLFEGLWNKDHIKKVDILFNETLGVGTRGKFYDAVGTLLDVVQNHMFQMLALTAMEEPESYDSTSLQHARAQVIANTKVMGGFLGQYNGYTQERDVPADSKTDTFSALHLAVDTPRWQGVPFYLVTGKCLDITEICIRVTFTSGDQLTLWIAPKPRLELTIHMDDACIMPLQLTYDYPIQDSYSTDVYKNILAELCVNNKAVDVAYEEIHAAWQLIAEIKRQHLLLYAYEKASKGPIDLELFNT